MSHINVFGEKNACNFYATCSQWRTNHFFNFNRFSKLRGIVNQAQIMTFNN